MALSRQVLKAGEFRLKPGVDFVPYEELTTLRLEDGLDVTRKVGQGAGKGEPLGGDDRTRPGISGKARQQRQGQACAAFCLLQLAVIEDTWLSCFCACDWAFCALRSITHIHVDTKSLIIVLLLC